MRNGKPIAEGRVLRWAMYDVASSNYQVLVPTFFGLYFLAFAGAEDGVARLAWGATAGVSMLVAVVVAPLVGAWSDRTGRQFAALLGLTAACVAGTFLLPAATRTGLLAGCAMFVVAQSAYTVASSVYDSLVVDVAPAGRRARASAFGWSLGLAGGLAGLLIARGLVEGYEPGAQVHRLEWVFLAAGVLFAVLAVPGLWGVRSIRSGRAPGAPADGPRAHARVIGTVRGWREHRELLKLVGSFFLVNDVLVTLQFFVAVVLASKFGIAVDGILRLLVMMSLIAIPSTLFFGVLADRWGPRRSLALLCVLLAGSILLLALGTAPWTVTAAVVLCGFAYGSVQAIYRSFYGSLVPEPRATELFGFNAVAGRLSAVAGPLVFGIVAALWGDSIALLVLLAPLLLGIVLLARVNTGAGGAGFGVPVAQGAAPRLVQAPQDR